MNFFGLFTLDLTQILTVILSAVFGMALTWLVAKWKEIKAAPYGTYYKIFVEGLAEAAETYFDGEGRGKEKLEWVLQKAAEYSAAKGLPFDAKIVTEMVEAFVHDVINAGKDKSIRG